MKCIFDKATELDKQELVSFLKQLKKDMSQYEFKLKHVKNFLNFLLLIFMLALSYLVLVNNNIYTILILGSVTVLLLLPIYVYSYRYNKVAMIIEYLNYYISQLSYKEFTNKNIEFNINKIVVYLSRQFTINRYRLIKYIRNKNTTELINMMKIA